MSAPASDGKARAAPEAAPAAARPALTPARGLTLLRRCACGGDAGSGASCASCAEKDPLLQRRDSGGAGRGIPASVHTTLAQPGRPLDAGTRQSMESRFGEDFSGVRVHDDSAAAQSARDVHAHAYTVGESIVFAPGQYQPHSESGQHLLAHELAHTVQQKGLQRSGISNLADQGPEYRRLEFEADRAADFAMRGGAGSFGKHGLGAASVPTLSRVPEAIPATGGPGPVTLQVDAGPIGQHDFQVTARGGAREGAATLQVFSVSPLFVPKSKGRDAIPLYRSLAGANLSTTLDMSGDRVATAMWQRRPGTSSLRGLWLANIGIARSEGETHWLACAEEAYANVNGEACEMDHIVELQLGGTNINQNFQALDGAQNGDSGSALFAEVSAIAAAIQRTPALTDSSASQVKLEFTAVREEGTNNFPDFETSGSGCPVTAPRTCLGVERCIRERVRAAEAAEPTVDPESLEDYKVAVGGLPTVISVPIGFSAGAPDSTEPVRIAGSRANRGAATLVPGLSLRHLHRGDPDFITVTVDPHTSTRIPITLDRDDMEYRLNVSEMRGDVHVLLFSPRPLPVGLAMTYTYLSPGTITSIDLNDDGTSNWLGEIRSEIPFVPNPMAIEFRDNRLTVGVPLDREAMSDAIPGFTVTEASLGLDLSPELAGRGHLGFALGRGSTPLATGSVDLTAGVDGFSAIGEIHVAVPGVDDARGTVRYLNGEWSGQIVVESSQINIPNVQSGRLQLDMDSTGITPSGEVQIALPNDLGSATLGITRRDGRFEYSVDGTIDVPGLTPGATIGGTYDGRTLVARARGIGFTWQGLNGSINVTYRQVGTAPGTITGDGRLTIRRGNVTGTINVVLNESGRFSGDGTVSYPLTIRGRRIDASATVIIGEDQSVRVEGAIRLPEPIQFFERFADNYNLLSFDRDFAVPGLSIGVAPLAVGVMAIVRGGVSVGYGFGPGELRDIEITGGFNPLAEHIDPSINFHCRLVIPVSAYLSATIGGGLELEAGIGRVRGTLDVTATLNLGVDFGGTLDVGYANEEFTVDARPGIEGDLELGLSLDANARAELGAGPFVIGVEKTWNLGRRDVTLGHFSVHAPIHYGRDGLRVPRPNQLEWGPIVTPNTETIIGQLFSGSNVTEREVPT